jgi:hypothetical protein
MDSITFAASSHLSVAISITRWSLFLITSCIVLRCKQGSILWSNTSSACFRCRLHAQEHQWSGACFHVLQTGYCSFDVFTTLLIISHFGETVLGIYTVEVDLFAEGKCNRPHHPLQKRVVNILTIKGSNKLRLSSVNILCVRSSFLCSRSSIWRISALFQIHVHSPFSSAKPTFREVIALLQIIDKKWSLGKKNFMKELITDIVVFKFRQR